MLKVVKLLKLYVENFRGIKNFVLTPDGRSATVQGGNGTGKSTLMAAFLWLLTGKDAQGRENYNVFPLGTDGNRLSGCSPITPYFALFTLQACWCMMKMSKSETKAERFDAAWQPPSLFSRRPGRRRHQ